MDDRAGPNNCMPPVRIGLVVIDFGPIFSWSGRWFGVNLIIDFGPKFWPGPNFIGSKFWFELNRSETNWSGTWSVFSVPVRVGPVRSVFLSKIFELISKFSRIFMFVDDNV